MNHYDETILRNLRTKQSLSAEALAQKSGLTRSTIVKLESGCANPTLGTIKSLANVFGLMPSELVGLIEEPCAQKARIRDFEIAGLCGICLVLPEMDIFHLKGPKGLETGFDPIFHEGTNEVCYVLSGEIIIAVSGQIFRLRSGMAIEFKAMQDHRLEIVSDAEFLILHPGKK